MKGKPKCSEGKLQKVLVDRISNLPNSILAHIPSFLPTKDSVATLLLSKRWEFIWRYTSNLYFCHVGDKEHTTSNKNNAKYMKFANFVTRVLLLHDVKSIDNVVFDFSSWSNMIYDPIFMDNLNNWVATVVARNVKSFKFRGGNVNNRFLFPRCIFTSNSVEILDLGNITTFGIERVYTFGQLISGCLSLHTLYLDNIRHGNYRASIVHSKTLQHLTIISPTGYLSSNVGGSELYIDAPALKYLRVDDCRCRDFTMGRSPSFVEAKIAFNECLNVLWHDLPGSFNDFEAIFNVKILSLDDSASTAIGQAGLSNRFSKLTKLTVYHCCEYQNVMDFVIGSNTLETLTVKKISYDHAHDNWTEPNCVPDWLLACLKVVSMDGFSDHEDHMAMAEYILKNSGQLESLSLKTINMDGGKMVPAFQKISNFERRSKKCNIDFS